jgi:aldehyde:ferredoxin oxidoreductase
VRAGRYFIAKTLLELGAATVDPLSPAKPLIFSAGPFAGTTFSNANRTSGGLQEPADGRHQGANGGGTSAMASASFGSPVHPARRGVGRGWSSTSAGRDIDFR